MAHVRDAMGTIVEYFGACLIDYFQEIGAVRKQRPGNSAGAIGRG